MLPEMRPDHKELEDCLAIALSLEMGLAFESVVPPVPLLETRNLARKIKRRIEADGFGWVKKGGE